MRFFRGPTKGECRGQLFVRELGSEIAVIVWPEFSRRDHDPIILKLTWPEMEELRAEFDRIQRETGPVRREKQEGDEA